MRYLKTATSVFSLSRTILARVGASSQTQKFYRTTFAKNLTSQISWTSCKWTGQWSEITAKTSRSGQYNQAVSTISDATKAVVSVNLIRISQWHGSESLVVLSFRWVRNVRVMKKAPLIARQRLSNLTRSKRLFARSKIKPILTSYTSRWSRVSSLASSRRRASIWPELSQLLRSK